MYIITSKSHQIDKGGITCDRFRIFLKLDKTINNREQMERTYSEFLSLYYFVDASCRNVSRFYYSSPEDAIVIYNQGKDYPTSTLRNIKSSLKPTLIENQTPSTSKDIYRFNELLDLWITDFGETLPMTIENKEAQLKGVSALLDNEFYQGNKSNSLFKASSMMRKDGFDDDFITEHLLSEWELRKGDKDKWKDALSSIKGAFKYS